MKKGSGQITDHASRGETQQEMPPAAFMSAVAPAAAAMDVAEERRAAGMDAMGAALAHELNQPLTALMIYLQSLKRIGQGNGSADSRDLLDKALNEAERATDIVRRMRRLSLRPEPDRRTVDLNALCRDVIDLALLGVPRRPRIRTSLSPDLPVIQADPVQLRQVIVNLLRNAAEAAAGSRSPAVFLSTAIHDGAVQLTVADNGPGVEPRIASKLFRAFETSKANGQGLGLAISRMIAQNHGGDVVMKSAAGEQGAVFALILPLQ
jgi:two-component system, LuxR family, sensor kinase FixL